MIVTRSLIAGQEKGFLTKSIQKPSRVHSDSGEVNKETGNQESLSI